MTYGEYGSSDDGSVGNSNGYSMMLVWYGLWTTLLSYNLYHPYNGPLPKWNGNAKIISLLAILWTTETVIWRLPFGIFILYCYWLPSSLSYVDHIAAMVIIINMILVLWYTIMSVVEARRVTRAALRDLPTDELVAAEPLHCINVMRLIVPCYGLRNHPRVHRVDDIVYASHPPLPHHKKQKTIDMKLDVYRPISLPSNRPVLLWIHGGAWISGRKDHHGAYLLNQIAARGWVVVSTSYRLAPKWTLLHQVIDCKLALKWIKDNGASYGMDIDNIYVAGGSAGGHLASLLATTPNTPQFQPGFEQVDTHLRGCVSLYGVMDLTHDTIWPNGDMVNFLEKKVIQSPYDQSLFASLSPHHQIKPHHNVPMFLLHGDYDIMVDPRQSSLFAAKLRAATAMAASSGDTTSACATTLTPVLYAQLPYASHSFESMPTLRNQFVADAIYRFLETIHRRRTRNVALSH